MARARYFAVSDGQREAARLAAAGAIERHGFGETVEIEVPVGGILEIDDMLETGAEHRCG